MEACEFLPWDSQFFGRRVARVKGHRLDRPLLEGILAWCGAHRVECLYFLADSNHSETVKLAEQSRFHLVDIRITLQREMNASVQNRTPESSPGIILRPWRPEDLCILREIARHSYHDTRFYFDPCFEKRTCDALYETWIQRSCEGYADEVWVAELNRQPVGYITCHLPEKQDLGRIGLVGVAPQTRGQGLAQLLVDHSLGWFAGRGAKAVQVITQGRNVIAQRLYQRCGFLSHAVQFWYHRWMPDRQ